MANYSPKALLCFALLLGCPLLPALDGIENSSAYPADADSLPTDNASPLDPQHTSPASPCNDDSAPNCPTVDTGPDLREGFEDVSQELRNEVLALREKTVDWWLTGIAAFATLMALIFAVGGVFGGYLVKKDTESTLEQAKDILAEMKEMHAGASEAKQRIESYASSIPLSTSRPEPIASEAISGEQEAPLQGGLPAKAKELEDSGDIRGAIAEWRKVLEGSKHEAMRQQALHSIGYLEGEVADLPNITPKERRDALLRALSAHDQSLSSAPDDATVLVNRGQVRRNLGGHEEAMEDFRRAIEIGPKEIAAMAHSNLGSIEASEGQYDEAIRNFDQAIDLDPHNAMAYNNRGGAKSELGRHGEAIEDLDRAVELEPSLAMAYSNRGSAKARLNLHQEAVEDFTSALEREPTLAAAYGNRGIARKVLGADTEALQDMREALRLAEAQDSPQNQALATKAREILAEWERGASNPTP